MTSPPPSPPQNTPTDGPRQEACGGVGAPTKTQILEDLVLHQLASYFMNNILYNKNIPTAATDSLFSLNISFWNIEGISRNVLPIQNLFLNQVQILC